MTLKFPHPLAARLPLCLLALSVMISTAWARSGDVNNDGEVDMADVRLVLSAAAGLHDAGALPGIADVAGPDGDLPDGYVTILDACRIVQIINNPPPRVVAQATGPNNGGPGASDMPFVPVINIRWSLPHDVAAEDILGYAVYRNREAAAPVFVTSSAAVRSYFDDGRVRQVQGEPAGLGSGKSDGLVIGATERYVIRTAYRVGANVHYTDSNPSTLATALLPPCAVSAQWMGAQSMSFTFRRVPGGDTYVIQTSENPHFSLADTWPKSGRWLFTLPPVYGPASYWANNAGDPDKSGMNVAYLPDPRFPELLSDPSISDLYTPSETVTVDLGDGRLDPRAIRYWRVGVASSRDDVAPPQGDYVWGDSALLVPADG